MGEHVAELAGVELDKSMTQEIAIGGLRATGVAATVRVELRQGRHSHGWTLTVYFCDPWPWAFGLLGLAGLDPFLLTIDSYEEWSELLPRSR
jgi:hypothetical protein